MFITIINFNFRLTKFNKTFLLRDVQLDEKKIISTLTIYKDVKWYNSSDTVW